MLKLISDEFELQSEYLIILVHLELKIDQKLYAFCSLLHFLEELHKNYLW